MMGKMGRMKGEGCDGDDVTMGVPLFVALPTFTRKPQKQSRTRGNEKQTEILKIDDKSTILSTTFKKVKLFLRSQRLKSNDFQHSVDVFFFSAQRIPKVENLR